MNMPIGYILCESGIVAPEDAKFSIIREADEIEYPDKDGNMKKHRRVIAESILQTADVLNRNKRIYPKQELFPQLESERSKQLLSHGMMRGEAGHPLDTSLIRQQTIDPKNVCVQYTKFWTEGNYVWGQFKGTNNDLGESFDIDLREGCIPEFSLRALGSVESTPRGAIVSGLKLITYDNVIFQSDYEAFTRRIVSESANGLLTENAKLQQDIICPIFNDQVKNYIIAESANFKTIKESFDIFYDTIQLSEDGHHVLMMSKTGDFLNISLERYISNEIYSYAERNK